MWWPWSETCAVPVGSHSGSLGHRLGAHTSAAHNVHEVSVADNHSVTAVTRMLGSSNKKRHKIKKTTSKTTHFFHCLHTTMFAFVIKIYSLFVKQDPPTSTTQTKLYGSWLELDRMGLFTKQTRLSLISEQQEDIPGCWALKLTIWFMWSNSVVCSSTLCDNKSKVLNCLPDTVHKTLCSPLSEGRSQGDTGVGSNWSCTVGLFSEEVASWSMQISFQFHYSDMDKYHNGTPLEKPSSHGNRDLSQENNTTSVSHLIFRRVPSSGSLFLDMSHSGRRINN